MDRLVQRNVLAMSGRAVEAAGRRRRAPARQDRHDHARQPAGLRVRPGRRRRPRELAEVAQLASLADETPEGRSIVVLAKEQYGLRARELGPRSATFIPFSATDAHERRRLRRQAVPQGRGRCRSSASCEEQRRPHVPTRARRRGRPRSPGQGGTPLVVAQDNFVLGVIHLKDIVKGGMGERFDELRQDGHPHGHDHRRQPRHRRRDRPRRQASTTSSPKRPPRPRWP